MGCKEYHQFKTGGLTLRDKKLCTDMYHVKNEDETAYEDIFDVANMYDRDDVSDVVDDPMLGSIYDMNNVPE